MTYVPLESEGDRQTRLSASRQRLQVQQVYRGKRSQVKKNHECVTGDLVSNLAWFGGEDVSHGHAGVAHADSRALK